MGFALARALAARGAEVTLVAGPVTLRTPVGIARRIDVETADEMLSALEGAFPSSDLLVMSAAVADYRPRERQDTKIKKRASESDLSLPLFRTPDILLSLSRRPDRARLLLLGFAAETNDVAGYARQKLVEKDLDWIFANDVSTAELGFGPGDNAGQLFARDGSVTTFDRAAKDALATALVAHLAPTLSAHRATLEASHP
jgi:phosphopantothenoylcysteine decarboxylase/phosphopantothenate--cysteine ligase